MGRLLEEYLANNVPQLQDIVSGGQQQPEGATTFPLPEQGPLQGQPIGPDGQPTGPMGVMPPPGGGKAQNLEAAPVPSFAPPGQPAPTFQGPEVQPQQDRSAEFEQGPDSFQGMAKEHDEADVNKAIDAIEESGTNLDEAYTQATGGPPEKGMSRKEKGLILMEFGLNLMAQSGTGEGTAAGDIGKAGVAAFQGHRGREVAKQKALVDAEDRKLERRKAEAQIKKAERADVSIKADADGNYIIVDKQTGESKPVLMDGKPVQESDREKFASEVDRLAYEALECEGLSGSALKSCKRRALAYGKGGGAKVAFPELERADQTDRVMKNLEDPDKKSAKYRVPSNGQTKRWKDMTPNEQVEVAEAFVDRRMEIINRGNVETKDGAGKSNGGETFGLSTEDVASIKPGEIVTLSDGKRIRRRDGRLEEVK